MVGEVGLAVLTAIDAFGVQVDVVDEAHLDAGDGRSIWSGASSVFWVEGGVGERGGRWMLRVWPIWLGEIKSRWDVGRCYDCSDGAQELGLRRRKTRKTRESEVGD